MGTYVWGCGDYLKKRVNKRNLLYYEIDGFIDRSERVFLGKKVLSPDSAANMHIDLIVIGSKLYYEEIKKQITDLHIESKIIFLDDFIKEKWIKDMPVDIRDAMNERQRMLTLALSAKLIPQERMASAKAFANRIAALDLIPNGGRIAEVGVAYGDFSKILLEKIRPQKFYAIDYFNGNKPGGDIWGRTEFRDSGLTHYEWYCQRFSKYIDAGLVEVRQGISWEVLERFPNDYFDYVYVDAEHAYDAVNKDVNVLKKKVKNGGIITFNDYTMYNFYIEPGNPLAYFGVANVANAFVCNSKSIVLGIALERCLSMDLIIEYRK